jgi:hypothetical protein
MKHFKHTYKISKTLETYAFNVGKSGPDDFNRWGESQHRTSTAATTTTIAGQSI